MDERCKSRGGPLYWLGRRSRRFWIIAVVMTPVLYVASYLALVTPGFPGDVYAIDMEEGAFIHYYVFSARYGPHGDWNSLEGIFRPIHIIDMRMRPKKWIETHRQKFKTWTEDVQK